MGSSDLQCEELGYPSAISYPSFAIPLPETFDPILQLPHVAQYGGSIQEGHFRFADDSDDNIDTVVFPEAKSASLLSQVLLQTKWQPNVPVVSREALSAAIVEHARTVVSTPWREGSRFAALSLTYT